MAKLPVSLDQLAILFPGAQQHPPLKPNAQLVESLVRTARTGSADAVSSSIALVARQCNTGMLGVLLLTVDPASGGSLLHMAAEAANINAVRGIRTAFRGGTFRVAKGFHLLMTHKDFAGDTALHVAARSGHQEVVTAVYRLFCDDVLPGEERLEGGPPPAEERDRAYTGDEEEDYAPPLLFLVEVNDAGHDAAAEARDAGNDEIAQWLEAAVGRLDPQGLSREAAERERMGNFIDQLYH